MDSGAGTDRGTPAGLPIGHVADWESLAIDYLDGTLDAARIAAVETHLAGCPDCASALRRQAGIQRWLRGLEPVAPPAYLEAAVMDAWAPTSATAQTRRGGTRGVFQRVVDGVIRRPWIPAAVAAVIVLIALAGSEDFFRTGRGGSQSATVSTAAAAAATASTGNPGLASESTAPRQSSPQDTGTSGEPVSTEVSKGGALTTVSALGGADTTAAATATTVGISNTPTTAPAPGTSPFSATPPAIWVTFSSGASATDPASAARIVESITGLAPLPASRSLGGPTFAALVSTSALDRVLDLLRGAGLTVKASAQPDPAMDQAAADAIVDTPASSYPVLSGTPEGDVSPPSGDADTYPAGTEGYMLMVLAPEA